MGTYKCMAQSHIAFLKVEYEFIFKPLILNVKGKNEQLLECSVSTRSIAFLKCKRENFSLCGLIKGTGFDFSDVWLSVLFTIKPENIFM